MISNRKFSVAIVAIMAALPVGTVAVQARDTYRYEQGRWNGWQSGSTHSWNNNMSANTNAFYQNPYNYVSQPNKWNNYNQGYIVGDYQAHRYSNQVPTGNGISVVGNHTADFDGSKLRYYNNYNNYAPNYNPYNRNGW